MPWQAIRFHAGLGGIALVLALVSGTSGQETPWTEVIRRAQSSVVYIRKSCAQGAESHIGFGSGFLVKPPDLQPGLGSWPTGPTTFVVTNDHVISCREGTTPLSVPVMRFGASLTTDWNDVPLKIVGRDAVHDLALLTPDHSKTQLSSTVINEMLARGMAFSPTLQVGEMVIAGGFPAELPEEPTWTHGMASAVNRNVPGLSGRYVQIDVAINPGNSGGPLLNAQGEVVGVIVRAFDKLQGISLAIPADRAQRFMHEALAGSQRQ